MSNDTTNTIKIACRAAAARLLAAVTPERRAVCLIRARQVFDTAAKFPTTPFISTADKAGFVVWSSIGTPFKTEAVQAFIDAIVDEAQQQHQARAAVAPEQRAA